MQLETERLILRPMGEPDADVLFPLINDADVAFNLLAVPHPYPEDAYVPWIRQCREAMERKEMYEAAIVLRETGLPIGDCTLMNVSWKHLNAEIGYWLGKKYWGNGYMSEAVKGMLCFGFDELGLERIYAICFERNKASARVLEKAGLKYEGLMRHGRKKGEEFVNLHLFGIIREDFAQ